MTSAIEIREEYGQHGMNVAAVVPPRTVAEARDLFGFKNHQYSICYFSGSAPPRTLKDGSKPADYIAAYYHAYAISWMNNKFNLDMPQISGGGRVSGCPHQDGYMSQLSHGVCAGGSPTNIFISEGLIIKEGLPTSKGITRFLKDKADNTQLGPRCEALLLAGNLFVPLRGGLGTNDEVAQILVDTSVIPSLAQRKTILVNPRTTNREGKEVGYYDRFKEQLDQQLLDGLINERSAGLINNQVIVYTPPKAANPFMIAQDMVTLTLAARILDTRPGLDATPRYLQRLYADLRQMSKGSHIDILFPHAKKKKGPWIESVEKLVAKARPATEPMRWQNSLTP